MKRKTFYQFSAPSNLVMIVLMVFPLAMAAILSLHFVTFININAPDFVGFKNYGYILTDPKFWEAFRFSILIIVFTVPSQIFLGFVMALLLDQVSMGVRGVFLALMLLPFIVVPVVGTLMFKQLFEVGGLIEYLYKIIFGRPYPAALECGRPSYQTAADNDFHDSHHGHVPDVRQCLCHYGAEPDLPC